MTGNRRRILVIDNLAVESARRSMYRLLSQRPEFEVHLLVPRRWKETGTEIVLEDEFSNQLHLHPSDILFGYRPHRVVYSGLFRIIKVVRPDFVLAVHAPENYATLQLLAARRLGQPSMKIGLFASRNIDLASVGFPFKLGFLNSICDWVTAKAGVEVVYQRPRSFGDLYSKYTERTVYIPHNVDSSVFKSDVLWKKERSTITLGYVGRLAAAKGIHLLIQCVAKLPRDAHLLIVGEGEQRERLKLLTHSLGIADRVRFEPPVPYAAMPELLNRLDLLVLPSLETPRWKELFGRILIEAMACEVAVVASNSGGIPEVVGDAGTLFQTGSVADLLDKLSNLIESPLEREALGKKGRERVKRLYDTRVVAEMLAGDFITTLQHDDYGVVSNVSR